MKVMKTNYLVRSEQIKVKGGVLYLTAKLYNNDFKQEEYFSLTYEKRNKRCWLGGGSAHYSNDPDVRKAVSEFGLEHVEQLHLCNYLGQPSHVLANGVYWATKDTDTFQQYLRLTDKETEEAKSIYDKTALFVFLCENHIFERWEREAEEAIAEIINGRNIEFESTFEYSKIGDITSERYAEEKKKLKEGYYTPRRMECHKRTKLDKTTLFGSRFNEVDYTDHMGSTVTLMEYIRDYGIDPNINTHFLFKNNECLVVSEEAECDIHVVDDVPVEQWHDVFGMKRIKVPCGWYAFINGKYYYIS